MAVTLNKKKFYVSLPDCELTAGSMYRQLLVFLFFTVAATLVVKLRARGNKENLWCRKKMPIKEVNI